MLVVTTNNGLWTVEPITYKTKKVLDGVFFGIGLYKDGLIVSEDVLTKNKQLVGTKLRFLNSDFKDTHEPISLSIRQVHQILVVKDKLFITETYIDKIWCLHLELKFKLSVVVHLKSNLVPRKVNTYSLNALCERDGNLYIGFNNHTRNAISGVAKLPLDTTNYNQTIRKLPYTELKHGIKDSHDLEPYEDDILITASRQGFIYSLDNEDILFNTERKWVRGLAISEHGVWVGYSPFAIRENRFNTALQCSVNLFSHKDFRHVKQVTLHVGQIRDLMYLK